MANSFYTPTEISAEFVRLLEQELVLGNMVGTDMSSDFAMNGSTVYVRRQMQYLGQDDNIDLTSFTEDITEGTVAVSMNKTWSNKVAIGALDRTLSFDRVSDQIIKPMARRAAEKIETSIAALYPKFYHFDGTPGTPPATIASLADAGAYMTDVGIPVMGRVGFHSPVVAAKISAVLAQGYVAGTNKTALEKATIGFQGGFDNYTSAFVPTHTVSALGGTPLVNGASQTVTYATAKDTWTQSLITDAWTAAIAVRLAAGDVFTIANVFSVHPGTKVSTGRLQTFSVQSAASSDGSGNLTATISPPMIITGAFQTVNAAPADNAALTIKTGTAATAYRQSLILDPAAVTLVTRPLDIPQGQGLESSTRKGNKVTVSVSKWVDGNTLNQYMRCDMLWGTAVLDPRRGLRLTS